MQDWPVAGDAGGRQWIMIHTMAFGYFLFSFLWKQSFDRAWTTGRWEFGSERPWDSMAHRTRTGTGPALFGNRAHALHVLLVKLQLRRLKTLPLTDCDCLKVNCTLWHGIPSLFDVHKLAKTERFIPCAYEIVPRASSLSLVSRSQSQS